MTSKQAIDEIGVRLGLAPPCPVEAVLAALDETLERHPATYRALLRTQGQLTAQHRETVRLRKRVAKFKAQAKAQAKRAARGKSNVTALRATP